MLRCAVGTGWSGRMQTIRRAVVEEFRMTADEFLSWDSGDDQHYELVAGLVEMHAAPSDPHGTMTIVFGSLARDALRRSQPGTSCRPVAPARVRSAIPGDETVREPDIVITCSPPSGSSEVIDPKVVVELVSPKEGPARDRAKVPFYQTIPSIHTIILLFTTEIRAEVWRRTERGWSPKPDALGRDDRLAIPQIDFEAPVIDLYENTGLV